MVETTLDLEHLKSWIGLREESRDLIAPTVVARMRAFHDLDPEVGIGDPLPELWHWFFFHPPVAQKDLGADGHHKVGGFLPPIDLPRRMWGGSRVTFSSPIAVGADVEKRSEVKSVDIKEGGSGTLGLVKVEHRVIQDGTLCLVEEQDLVYREPPSKPYGAASAPAAPDGATHSKTIKPDEVTLFRFSALTYNAHRIHYDRDYAMGVEGYPGLVVHGPFTASQLSLFATTIRGGERMSSFSFRGTSPLFDRTPFNIHAKPDGDDLLLWAERPAGGLAMKATASFE